MKKEITITDDIIIPIAYVTKNLGRAEYSLCTRYKYGKLTDIWLYPEQQEDMSYFYHIVATGQRSMSILGYGGLDDPKVWRFSYCKEHKCGSLRFYVPAGAKYLWVNFLSTLNIGFTTTNFKV